MFLLSLMSISVLIFLILLIYLNRNCSAVCGSSQHEHLAGAASNMETHSHTPTVATCLPDGDCEVGSQKCAAGLCLEKRDLPCAFDNLMGSCPSDQKCSSYGICISTKKPCTIQSDGADANPCK